MRYLILPGALLLLTAGCGGKTGGGAPPPPPGEEKSLARQELKRLSTKLDESEAEINAYLNEEKN